MATAIETFKRLSEHQIRGVMFHHEMMRAFDFLGMRGMKRLHEFRMFEEMTENDALNRYAVNHLNHIIIDGKVESAFSIPQGWEGVSRLDVTNDNRKKFWREMVVAWVKWEEDTKKAYEAAYKELCDIDEIAAAGKVRGMVEGVDMELKKAERMKIKFDMFNWDCAIYVSTCDDELHEEYRIKLKEDLHVNIC